MCVYAICKNEERFVDRWMDSVQEADMVVVLDTGSTDASVEKLRLRGALVYEKVIDPWRFDSARNIAMDFVPDDIDICVSNDLDEVFESGWRKQLVEAWRPETTRARYRFVWDRNPDGSAKKSSHMEKIHRRTGFRWAHPVHERLEFDGPEPETVTTIEGLVLHHHPDRTKSRSQYLPLLELAAEERPHDGQTIFWLGREYVYYDRHDDAIATLKRHLAMADQWDAERCASMRFIARCYRAKNDMRQAEAWLYRAIAECPDSREPYYDMALFGYFVSDWTLVTLMTEKILAIETPGRSGYLHENAAWGYSPYDLGAIATYWLGLYERSYEYAKKALELEPEDPRLRQNLRLAAEKLGDQGSRSDSHL